MKKLKLLSIFAILLAITFSCSDKIDPDTPDPGDELLITEFNLSPDFTWETTKNYTFRLNGGDGEVVRITSLDESVVFHKSTVMDDGGYTVNLRLPTYVNSVMVNDQEVALGGTEVQVDLDLKAKLVNRVLSFDGVDDYVDLGDISELNGVQTFTIEGRFYPTSVTGTYNIFSKVIDATHDIRIRMDGGSFFVEIGDGSDFIYEWTNFSTTFTTPQWIHFAVTYDGFAVGLTNRLKMYFNGTEITTNLTDSGTLPTNTDDLSGYDALLSSTADFFAGSMDEFRIWDDVRTSGEISANMNKKIIDPSADASLIAYYRMDEGTGTTLGDDKGSYDGTIYGASWGNYDDGWDSDGDGIDDDDDEFWNDPLRAHINYYPAADTGTVVFEDLWPGFGDYDCNDLVMGYQFKTITSATNTVTEVYGFFELRAHGAQLNNGFGFRLDNAVSGLNSDLTVTGYSKTGSAVTLGASGLETGNTKPVVIVMDEVKALMDNFVNTGEGSWSAKAAPVPITVKMEVPTGTYDANDFDLDDWNPFIFVDQVRGHEIHLLDRVPTSKVDNSLFGTVQDSSVIANGKYYRSKDLLPWALEFPTEFEYPFEKKEITRAYLKFQAWAESGGVSFTDWYSNTGSGYRDSQWIYK